MKIAMVGSGYVGLVSGACFADFGHDVVCIDKDPGKIERLERGEKVGPGEVDGAVRMAGEGRLRADPENPRLPLADLPTTAPACNIAALSPIIACSTAVDHGPIS